MDTLFYKQECEEDDKCRLGGLRMMERRKDDDRGLARRRVENWKQLVRAPSSIAASTSSSGFHDDCDIDVAT